MNSIHKRCMASLTSEDQARLKTVEKHWHDHSPFGRRVVPNIHEEHFLPDSAMETLIRVLIDHWRDPIDSVDTDDLDKAYQAKCYELVGLGGAVGLDPQPGLLGRCCSRDQFIAHLDRQYGPRFGFQRRAIEHFVDSLLLSLDPGSHGHCSMTTYSTWVTWEPVDGSVNPFAFMRHNSPEEVRSCLGLDRRTTGPFLLLVYRRPSSLSLQRATIADANLSAYFRPPRHEEDAHGWTVPWEPPVQLFGAIEYNPVPRPEAVHVPTELHNLVEVRQLPL